MKRAVDPAFLESILRDPRVVAMLDGERVERASESWDRTVALEWEPFGGVVFVEQAPRTYVGHWVFLPGSPGVIAKGRQAIAYLFNETNAERIVGMTPLDNVRAIRAAKAAGMRHQFDFRGYSMTELTREQWATEGRNHVLAG